MTIYCTHGMAEGVTRAKFQFRNLEKAHLFINHLRSRREPYVSLQSAMTGAGDALTIDDSTRAAYDAAACARKLGHEVTVFVNAAHIEHQQPYAFVLLSLLFDSVTDLQLKWFDSSFAVHDREAKKQARKEIKRAMLLLGDEAKQIALVQDIARENMISLPLIPEFLQPMGKSDVKTLLEMGVGIGNHGWSHRHPSALPTRDLASDVAAGAAWLEREFAVDPWAYAVPFGDVLPHTNHLVPPTRAWFMLQDTLSSGKVGPVVFNREPLRLEQ